MLTTGTQIERYEVERVIGQGGMATVYRVRHSLLGSFHAMKVPHALSSEDREALLHEGRTQARLDPEFVVPVTDVVQVEGALALVMPFVDGCTLSEVLAHYRPNLKETAAIAVAIAGGISSAHELGIVHRDLKPSNVLLQVKYGRVRIRVADFGLASYSMPDARLKDRFVGTPEYAAPEQFLNPENVDGRADLWALGVILFRMLVGERPFPGPTQADRVRQMTKEPLSLDAIPAGWDPLLTRLLHPEPEQRMNEAEAVRRAIEGLQPVELPRIGSPLADTIQRLRDTREVFPTLPSSEPTRRNTGVRKANAPKRLTVRQSEPTVLLDRRDRQTPEQDSTTVPRPTPSGSRLPASRDAFVGRKADLDTLQRAMTGATLMTLLGMGGTGKTRLALQFAREFEHEWRGGALFCDLTDVQDAEGISVALASSLGVPLRGGDVAEQVQQVLADREPSLVILDNFEQVAETGAPLVARWMTASPHLTFLVTSRILLNLQGEKVIPLDPLNGPDAVELFVERARRVRPGYAPTPDEEETIGELVRLLDRLPLAIELAAARFRMLSAARILERLKDRFRLLSSSQFATDRQATLRGAIDWSWNLLNEWERSALAQLSVLDGGGDLEAVEAIVSLDAFPEAPWPLDALQSLVDKSLVRASAEDRFDLLVSVREYAAEKLNALGEQRGVRDRHARYYSALGTPEAMEELVRHGGPAIATRRLLESENIMAALSHAIRFAQGANIVNAYRVASWVFESRGPFTKSSEWFQTIEEADVLTPIERAHCLSIRGKMDRISGARQEAKDALMEGLQLTTGSDDVALEAEIRRNLAHMLTFEDRFDESRVHWDRAEELARTHQLDATLVHICLERGDMEEGRGNSEKSRKLFQEGLMRAREMGNEEATLLALVTLSYADLASGKAYLEEAQAIVERRPFPRWKSMLLPALSYHHRHHQELEKARIYLVQTLEVARALGAKRRRAVTLENLGELSLLLGDLAQAELYYLEAIPVAKETWYSLAGASLGGLALTMARMGRTEAAAALLPEAEEILHPAGYPIEIAKLQLRKALVLRMVGRIEEAEIAFSEAESACSTTVREEAAVVAHRREYENLRGNPSSG